MNNKINIVLMLLFINTYLTIYLIYKCFNNKIIEGKKNFFKKAGDAFKKGAKEIGKVVDSGVDTARRETERAAEEARRESERIAQEAKREAERIAEEARRAAERLVIEAFEKLLNPINIFFSTLQNTTLILKEQGGI